MERLAKKRNISLDVIRCIALYFVVSIHFFLHSGFYGSIIVGSRMYLFTLIRTASMTCVPLFLMLSGYLLKNKTSCRQYYGKLIKTIALYFLASACCYLYEYRLSGTPLTFLLRTLSYSASHYAWYMNMYLGLFLLIPYLNILYNGLSNQRNRQGLIITLLIMTAFTGIVNCFVPAPNGGFQFSSEVSQYQIILPDWWHKLYPLTYYFIGAYLRDHPLKLSKKVNALVLILVILGNSTYNYCISYGQEFLQGSWQDWGSIWNVLQSALLFNLLAKTNFSRLPKKITPVLFKISDLSLSAFLVSWIFDDLLYPILIQYQPSIAYRLLWYPVTTLLVFAASLCLAWILDSLYFLTARGISILFHRGVTQ